jgi:hypothetical protein
MHNKQNYHKNYILGAGGMAQEQIQSLEFKSQSHPKKKNYIHRAPASQAQSPVTPKKERECPNRGKLDKYKK